MSETRLQKVLAERGIASRRAAERLIAAGRVTVEGGVVRTLGTKVAPDAHIEVDLQPTGTVERHRYLALNKPKGVVSTAHDERGRPTVVSLATGPGRLYPVGRLDADSEGLLVLTNDGAWAERVAHPRFGHEREYEVTVRGAVTSESLSALTRGVPLEEGTARALRVQLTRRTADGAVLRFVLTTGWKRQVRRMCAAVGFLVLRLVRVRIGPLALGGLAPGATRDLTPREVRALAEPAHAAPTAARPSAPRGPGRAAPTPSRAAPSGPRAIRPARPAAATAAAPRSFARTGARPQARPAPRAAARPAYGPPSGPRAIRPATGAAAAPRSFARTGARPQARPAPRAAARPAYGPPSGPSRGPRSVARPGRPPFAAGARGPSAARPVRPAYGPPAGPVRAARPLARTTRSAPARGPRPAPTPSRAPRPTARRGR